NEAELALRLRTGEEHIAPGHAQPVECEERLAPCDRRNRLRHHRNRIEWSAPQLQSWRPPPDEDRDVAQHVREEHVVAAEYISLADLATCQRGDMARGHVVDGDEVGPDDDERGRPPPGGVDDDPPARRRLEVDAA